MLDKQADPKVFTQIKDLLEKVNQSPTFDQFVVTLLQGQDNLTECIIGLKKEIGERDREYSKRMAVIENELTALKTKDRILSTITSKIGLTLLAAALALSGGVVGYIINKNLP